MYEKKKREKNLGRFCQLKPSEYCSHCPYCPSQSTCYLVFNSFNPVMQKRLSRFHPSHPLTIQCNAFTKPYSSSLSTFCLDYFTSFFPILSSSLLQCTTCLPTMKNGIAARFVNNTAFNEWRPCFGLLKGQLC